jgi:hypothetical protein
MRASSLFRLNIGPISQSCPVGNLRKSRDGWLRLAIPFSKQRSENMETEIETDQEQIFDLTGLEVGSFVTINDEQVEVLKCPSCGKPGIMNPHGTGRICHAIIGTGSLP